MKDKRLSDLADMAYKAAGLDIRRSELGLERSKLELDKRVKQAEMNYKAGRISLDTFNSLVDAAYKDLLGSEASARTKKLLKPDRLDEPFIGSMTLREFNALTPDAKEYALAKYGANVLGDTDFMTKREWSETQPTERQKFLEGLIDNPELADLEKELRKASRINISVGEKAESAAAVKGATTDVTTAKGLNAAVDKYFDSKAVKDQLFELVDDPTARKKKSAEMEQDFVRRQLRSIGQIVKEEWSDDGNSKTFTVRLPDGSTKEIAYAFRP